MSNKKTNWSALEHFLPPNTFSFINELLNEHTINLVITKPRKYVLGYYKPPTRGSFEHTITINGDLAPFAFFIILIHEIAHLKTFVLYKNTVAGHGKEWKEIYSDLLKQSLLLNCYPADLEEIIKEKTNRFTSLRSCTDDDMLRVLKKYDSKPKNENTDTIESLGVGSSFLYKEKIFFIKKKRRTRFLCVQKNTNYEYVFHGLVEVQKVM